MAKTNPKIISAVKIVGVGLIAVLVIILLPANKIASSIALTVAAITILLPIDRKPAWLKWARIAFVLALFAFVLHNISTTEYSIKYYHTGVKFFDQILYIFDQFLYNVFGTRLSR